MAILLWKTSILLVMRARAKKQTYISTKEVVQKNDSWLPANNFLLDLRLHANGSQREGSHVEKGDMKRVLAVTTRNIQLHLRLAAFCG